MGPLAIDVAIIIFCCFQNGKSIAKLNGKLFSYCFMSELVKIIRYARVGWFCDLFSLSRTRVRTKWLSEATCAPRLSLVSRMDPLNCRLTKMWSIRLCVLPSGDVQVFLWMSLWGEIVPVNTKNPSTPSNQIHLAKIYQHFFNAAQ